MVIEYIDHGSYIFICGHSVVILAPNNPLILRTGRYTASAPDRLGVALGYVTAVVSNHYRSGEKEIRASTIRSPTYFIYYRQTISAVI